MGARSIPTVPLKVKWQIHEGETLAAQLASRFKAQEHKKANSKRVNIVSPGLCDDALKRLAPSLEQYHGCDIIDLNPGNCIWSLKLHEALKPRWHALVEPDFRFYKPYLEETIGKAPSVFTHIPTDPFERGFWPNLLQEHGSHMKSIQSPTIDSGINRSLLVVANLGQTIRRSKAFNGPLAPFYLQHFLEAMYDRRDIHCKGLVKMLAWMPNDQTHGLSPRTTAVRTKIGMIFEGTVQPSYIVGQDRTTMINWRFRRHWPIDVASSLQVASSKSSTQIYDPPERRQPELGPHPITLPNTKEGREAMLQLPNIDKFFEELISAEAAFKNGEIQQFQKSSKGKRVKVTAEWVNLLNLRYRHLGRQAQFKEIEELVSERLAMDEEEKLLAQSTGSGDDTAWANLETKIKEWRSRKPLIVPTLKEKILKDVDDWRSFKMDPPVLAWDSRQVDQLLPKLNEFFPKEVLSLVDLEPRPDLVDLVDTPDKHVCLRFITQIIGHSGTRSVEELLERLTPGAGSQLAARVPSLLDPAKGGTRFLFDFRTRTLPIRTVIELAVAYEKFPLRPTLSQMQSQMTSTDRIARIQEPEP